MSTETIVTSGDKVIEGAGGFVGDGGGGCIIPIKDDIGDGGSRDIDGGTQI